MQNCVAIFITDYEQLIKSELIIKRKDNYMFFEKFFNYRINLVSVPLCESMTFYEKSKIFNKILFYNEFKKPSEIYDNIILLLNKKIQKAEQKNEVADLSKQLQHFIELLQHPRKTAKFYYVYSIFCTTINSEYLKLKDDASEWETVIVYYNKIDISKVVFILSYIQACLPTEFEQIQLKRISRYIDLLNNDDKENESRLLIIALCEDILFTKSSSIHISYEQMEVIKFIDALLINNADMINLVNSFTSQEQEWFDAIDNDQIGDIDASWSDIFDAILQNFSYSNIETGEHYIHKLFEFAIKEIKCKNIDINDIYQIFSPSLRNERWFTLNLYTMKGFYCSFCKTEIMNFLTDESIKYIRQFSLQFINFRFEVINKLIGYLLKYEEKEILDTAKDLMHNWKDNIEDRIIPFFEEIYRIDYLSDKIVDGKDFFVYLEDLYNLLSSYMEESKLSAYSDVQKDLNSMKLSIEDMRFFVQLINFQPGQKKSFNVADINKGDLEDTIKYFQDRFDNITDKLSLWHEFNKLFDYIRYEKDVKITSSQLKELHDLITIYIKESGHETMYYRKVLLDYAKLNHIELVN